VTDESVELSAKRLEILKEAVPKVERIAVLYNADDIGMVMRFENVEKAAQTLRVAIRSLGVREPNDFDTAFAAMRQQRPDAIMLVTDALTLLNRKRVIEFAALHKIPAMYEVNIPVREGGLMSYGASQEENYRLAAGYVDRILKGAQPRQLPVARPSRYYLAINRKTAETLGLTFPPSIVARADQVIE
jgi:putative ABC transport system substrate-binding protein